MESFKIGSSCFIIHELGRLSQLKYRETTYFHEGNFVTEFANLVPRNFGLYGNLALHMDRRTAFCLYIVHYMQYVLRKPYNTHDKIKLHKYMYSHPHTCILTLTNCIGLYVRTYIHTH